MPGTAGWVNNWANNSTLVKTMQKEKEVIEPTRLDVKLHQLKFNSKEIGEFILAMSGREPTYLEYLVITWSIDEDSQRRITMKINEKIYVDYTVVPHASEPENFVCAWMLCDPTKIAEQDIDRAIACELTKVYKEKISNLWGR